MSNNQNQSIEDRISSRTDLAVAGSTQVGQNVGGLSFQDMGQVMEFSKLMAVAGQAVPKHLRGQPGACLAVSLQALNWQMDPFAVANKSYAVNDRVAFEAQLIQAVIEQRAPIKGRIRGRYEGEGQKRVCILTVTPDDGSEDITYRSPEIGMITTKNSPLWKADPDQQLWYYSARAMCRRHFPDVLLGVYEKEELKYDRGMRDVTPQEKQLTPLQRKIMGARGEDIPEPQAEYAPAYDENTIDGKTVEQGEGTGHWTEEVPYDGAFPGNPEFDEGVKAFQGGKPVTDCPYEGEVEKAVDWVGGWHEAAKAADG